MKKNFITTLALAAVLIATTAIPAFASGHGSHHGGSKSTTTITKHAVCTITDCTVTGTHKHSGTNYYGHSYGDGHDYHSICDVTDCTLTGYHEHDGSYCFSHYLGDGHSYHSGSGHH